MRKARLACLAVAVCGSLALPSVAAAQEFPSASRFQKVTLNDRSGRAHESCGAARRPRPAQRTHRRDPAPQPEDRAEHDGGRHAGSPRRPLPARRGGCAGHRPRPELQQQPLGLRLLLAAAEHPGRRSRHGHQRGRRAVRISTTPADRARLALFKGVIRLSRFKFEGSHARLQHRAGDPRRPGRPRHLLPRRRQDRLRRRRQPVPLDGRRHEPVRVLGRLHADRRAGQPQPGVRCPAHVGQHERPARQDPAHPREGERQLQHPRGEPVPSGHGADEARDLRHGLPQPVPLRGRPQVEQRLRGRLLAGRERARSGARAPGHRPLDARGPAGQLRLALLHDA